MSMHDLIAKSRSLNPDFDLVKLAGDIAGLEQGFNALDPEAKSSLMAALIQARGADGTINRAPVEAWVKAPGVMNGTLGRAALAKQLEAAYAANPGAVEAMGKKYMMTGGLDAMRRGWGQDTKGGGWGNALSSSSGLGTYLPLGAGLMGVLGGAMSGNPWIALLGLLAAGYGGYKLWDHAKTLQDPELMRTATQELKPTHRGPQAPGAALDPQAQATFLKSKRDFDAATAAQTAARARIGEAANVVQPVSGWMTPFMGMGSPTQPAQAPRPPAPAPTPAPGPSVGAAPRPPMAPRLPKVAWASPGLPDRGDLANSVKSHIDLYRMKREIEQDRLLDPSAAGKMLAGIEYAERQIDSAQATVGVFGLASAPILGLASGIALGSLFATSPATQAGLASLGGGVVSGAKRLGLL